jgi:hypothetical protein
VGQGTTDLDRVELDGTANSRKEAIERLHADDGIAELVDGDHHFVPCRGTQKFNERAAEYCISSCPSTLPARMPRPTQGPRPPWLAGFIERTKGSRAVPDSILAHQPNVHFPPDSVVGSTPSWRAGRRQARGRRMKHP